MLKYIALGALIALTPYQSISANELNNAYWDGDSERVVQILKETIPVGEDGLDARSEALLVASEFGDLGAVMYLVEGGVDLEVVDESERTPLLIAASEGRTAVGIYLVTTGANIEARDYFKMNTPLLLASRSGDLELVQALIDAGANIKAEDYIGWTALNVAAIPYAFNAAGGDGLIVYLIDQGLDINHRDLSGSTVFGHIDSLGERNGSYPEIIALLVSLGGEI